MNAIYTTVSQYSMDKDVNNYNRSQVGFFDNE